MTTVESPHPILVSLDERFAEYASGVMRRLEAHLASERAPYGAVLHECWTYYLFVNWIVDQNLLADTYPALRILTGKAATSLLAAHALLKGGARSEAGMILRSLFEATVFAAIIAERDHGHRARLYEEWEHVDRWEQHRKYENAVASGEVEPRPAHHRIEPEKLAEAEANFKRVTANYGAKKPIHWAWHLYRHEIGDERRPDMRYLAKKTGRLDLYLSLYPAASAPTHASALTRMTHIAPGGRPTTGPIFDSQTANIAAMAVTFAHHLMESVLNVVGSPEAKALSVYSFGRMERIQQLARAADPRHAAS